MEDPYSQIWSHFKNAINTKSKNKTIKFLSTCFTLKEGDNYGSIVIHNAKEFKNLCFMSVLLRREEI